MGIHVGWDRSTSSPTTRTHFYRDASQPVGAQTKKKIMQEWKLLAQHLPESITVRPYEEKGLLRAAIVGASATPYHDGLYFFDIYLPPDYPAQPPKVSYQSFGYQINPNIHSCGFVCLSLLNTGNGKRKSRGWNPKKSTILQVLLSIQALLLNERPYYNEPGNGSFKPGSSGEKRSFAYNEKIFICSCLTMVYLIDRPPRGFEAQVKWHFRNRARAILRACEAYANGRVRVGYFLEDAPQGPSEVPVTEEFKRSIRIMYRELFIAFSEEGASLAGLSRELSLDESPKRSLDESPKQKKGLGIIIFKMIKKFWN